MKTLVAALSDARMTCDSTAGLRRMVPISSPGKIGTNPFT